MAKLKYQSEHLRVEKKITWTFHIHKVRVRTLNKTLLLVPPLLLLRGWVQQVFCELYLKKEKGKLKILGQEMFVELVRNMSALKLLAGYITETWLDRGGLNV